MADTMADTMLAALVVRVGSDEARENVIRRKTLGTASLTEIETDLVAAEVLSPAQTPGVVTQRRAKAGKTPENQ
jgi:hypothetical protein